MTRFGGKSCLTPFVVPVDDRPHVPHVTLLRKSMGGEIPACRAVDWSIGEFVLVKSVTESDGARYEVMRRWGLPRVGEGVGGELG